MGKDKQRHDAILMEDVRGRLEAIDEVLRDLPEIKAIVGGHTEILTRLTAVQEVQTDILREHSADIREIKQILKEHSTILALHSEDLTEIKHEVTGLKAASHTH